MEVRLATLADMNVSLSLDHTSVTDHVWQMKVQKAAARVAISFDVVRLPRQMRAEYPRELDQLSEDWQRGEGYFVAELDGSVRGYVDVIIQQWPRMACLVNLAVHREYRRRGVASTLVRQACQWARDQEISSVLAEATTKNYPALCLYEKLGFQFCGFNDHYYPNRDIALFFVLGLR
jgi:ribosomal protein S18 acetylase RimI-like enzyme